LGHHLLELLLLIPEAVLLLVVALAVVILLGVVVLVGGGVELLPLGAVGDEVGGAPHSKQPLGDLLLSLWNMYKAQNFLTSRAILSSGMLSYCSSEAAHKEDKANSKADDSVVLVGLATWPPTRY
jgi:type IV secretory pathway TrbL component